METLREGAQSSIDTEDLVVVCLGDLSQGTWLVEETGRVALGSAEGPEVRLKHFDTGRGGARLRFRTSRGREQGDWEVG